MRGRCSSCGALAPLHSSTSCWSPLRSSTLSSWRANVPMTGRRRRPWLPTKVRPSAAPRHLWALLWIVWLSCRDIVDESNKQKGSYASSSTERNKPPWSVFWFHLFGGHPNVDSAAAAPLKSYISLLRLTKGELDWFNGPKKGVLPIGIAVPHATRNHHIRGFLWDWKCAMEVPLRIKRVFLHICSGHIRIASNVNLKPYKDIGNITGKSVVAL
mmetsp:Transcript_115055/g.229101  ORF Transcript_115055/g.229101 Transcript_115055/m.229101 type:complete len:214 (+) Transcript_115055:30-671(+)